MRKIIHVDMDCFYAAVEMREDPSLVGKPIAVGGEKPRSVVATCNYEARQFGVRSAMSGYEARKKCPHIICLPLQRELYERVSGQIRAIFDEYTRLVEPLSLDEAYLDVTDAGRFAWDIAKEIRAKIFEKTNLTASAGIAENKMLAKIASDWRKPNGQYAIRPEQVSDFMLPLPVKKIPGVGPTRAARWAAQGFLTCGNLQSLTELEMVVSEGKWGKELYQLCRGRDDRKVDPNRVRKSLSIENTFEEDLTTIQECEVAITTIAEGLLEDIQMKASDRKIETVFVKVKFSDRTETSKQCACAEPSADVFGELLAEAYDWSSRPVRLLGAGVRFANEDEDDPQMEIFS